MVTKGFSVEVKHKLQKKKKILCWEKLLFDVYLTFNAACTWEATRELNLPQTLPAAPWASEITLGRSWQQSVSQLPECQAFTHYSNRCWITALQLSVLAHFHLLPAAISTDLLQTSDQKTKQGKLHSGSQTKCNFPSVWCYLTNQKQTRFQLQSQ